MQNRLWLCARSRKRWPRLTKRNRSLLHGVTGSGKTEIYLQAIRSTLARGKTAIVLVPEISLTPQTVERFKSRFAAKQDEVAVLHSHLSEGERHDEWHKIHSGRARIVIGARSAVFAPLANLGLIVVDEEHENSYKQEEAPRYHARDVAVVRAKIEKCVVVLGTATPSLESYYNATREKYQLVSLTQRVDDCQMPLMRIVDLRQERRKQKGLTILADKLRTAIGDRLEKGEQTILFLNRRGFSTSLLCSNCGEARNCPNCSVALTFHRTAARLSCHLCGHTAAVPKKCPACNQDALIYSGFGTEKVEVERQPNLSERGRAPDGCRFDDAKGCVSRDAARFPCRKDRYSRRHADDRQRSAFSERDAGRNH